MNDTSMTDINPEIPRNAVSVYTQDSGMDDFPVLKAFQQYIDSEQSKARKRLVTMGIFFTLLIGAVIAVFVAMLMLLSQRNQELNDRLVEYAMTDRNRQPTAPVVVQSSPQPDSAAIQALAAKLDQMQKDLAEREKKAQESAEKAAQAAKAAAESEAAKPKGPTPEQIEIARLKALLDVEKQKAAAEQERRRQEELEAYRRKHYPELYQPAPKPAEEIDASPTRKKPRSSAKDEIDEVLDLLDDDDAISYYDEEENDAPRGKTQRRKPAKKPRAEPQEESSDEPPSEAPPAKATPATEAPVEGPSSSWRIPTE